MTYTPVITANVSVLNSTTTILTAGQTFTGTPEDVSQYASLSVSFYVQQTNATGNIFVQFSNVSTNAGWIPISNTVTAVNSTNASGFTLDTTMMCQYFRILYVNDSVAQTSFMIQSIYHPQARVAQKTTRYAETPTDYSDMINTRSMIWGKTTDGGIYEPVATNGENSLVVTVADPRTAFGEIAVSQHTPVTQIDFVYGINTVVTSNVTAGSNGYISVSNGLLSVTANSQSGSSMAMFSPKKFLKYRAGESTLTRITATFTAGAPAQSLQMCGTGFLDPTTNIILDGMGFGYSGSVFGVHWFRNSINTFIPQSSFNYDKLDGTGASGFTIDPIKINILQYKFQYLGGGNLFFYVLVSNGRWVLAHMIKNAGTLTSPIFRDPTMHAMWYSNCYTTSSTPVTVQGGSCGQFLEGERRFLGPKGSFVGTPVAALANNTQTLMFALKNATYFNGIPNRSQAHIRSISFGGNGSGSGSNNPNGVITFTLTRNPTGGPTVWLPYNGSLGTGTSGSNIIGNSTISSNISPLTTLTGGNTGFTHVVAIGGQSGQIDLSDYEITLNPNDVLCFSANVVSTGSGCYVGASVFWVEDL